MTESVLKIGLPTNLTRGLKPNWNPRTGHLNILYPPHKQPIQPTAVEPVANRGSWSFPEISLHESARSLLDALIPYKVVSAASEMDAPLIGAGALLIGAAGSEASIKPLSATLGVDLSNPDFRYALVKLTRLDGINTHASAASGILVHARPRRPDPAYGLSEAFISASTKLCHAGRSRLQDYGSRLRKEDADSILDAFDTFGTHYISAIQLGDSILQVFAYLPEQFAKIQRAYADERNPLSGPGSQNFAQFTTDAATGRYGFVQQYGHLICLSNAREFNATLGNGDWQDHLWSKHDSIFSLFNTDSALSLVTLQETFTGQAPVEVQLASLSLMIEQKRGLIWQRIFKAAMTQKYRDTIQPNFAIYDTRDFVQMLPQDQAGVISFLATPTINLYQTRLDLSDMQFVAAGEVKNCLLFANVLSIQSTNGITIPGKAIRLFGQVFDMRTHGHARVMTIADEAFASLQIGCDEFLGALAVWNTSGSAYCVIVDGLKFGLKGHGPDALPVVVDDVRVTPPADAVPLLINSLQFSMTFAEAVISDQSGCAQDGVQRFVRQYLRWVARTIPSTTRDPEQLALRVRAMDLAHYAINPDSGSFVPILPYTDYEQYVQSILNYLDRIQFQIAQNEQKIANRRQEELVIDVARTLNQNIIASGELISDIIAANAAQQKDLAGFYDALITQKQAEAAQQRSKLNALQTALFEAQGDVDFAVQQYQSAVKQWETIEAIKFGLDVATNLFALGITIATPASAISAVKDMSAAVQMIQKTLNVLNALAKLYHGTATGIKGLQGAQATLDGLEGAPFGSPATIPWDELSILFNQIMATGPDVKAEKAALQAAFSILVLRGKAVTTAQSALHAIEREIYTNQQQKTLNTRQANRLAALQDKLRPAHIADLDRSAIDLMALTGHLSFIQNQMLGILAKAFLQQDLALQYANLQPATPILSFSLLKFSAAIVQQKATTIQAKSALAHYQAVTTKPIDFVIAGVRPDQLTHGNTFNTAIFLNAPEFYQYVNARVVAVVATIDGVKSTDSGTYLLRLAYDGTPFHDRNIERDPLNFRTPWRERIYEYRAADDTPTFSDGGKSWSDGVSRITPFSNWEISFPDTRTNKGIRFDKERLTIRLSFILEARIVDAEKILQLRTARKLAAMQAFAPHAPAVGFLAHEQRALETAPRPALLTTAAGLPAASALIAQMYAQGSCTNGWDVVFNMGLAEINTVLKKQYEDLKTHTAYKNTISVNTSEQYPGDVTVINKFEIEYGYPLLGFSINNNNSATLSMEILKGSMQKCSKIGSGPENCDPPQSLTGETLTAVVSLTKVAGSVQVDGGNHHVLKVLLDMQEGAFSISNIDLSDETKVAFNQAVKSYFVNNPVIFLINQLDLTNIPTLNALRPKDFIFKPLKTPSNNEMLQLFIMTDGRAVRNYSQAFLNNIPEPLPLGQASSMMVRSGIIFHDVLPQSLKNNGWTLQGVDPGDPAKAWSGKFSDASIIGRVDLSKLDHYSSSGGQGGGSTTHYTYSIPGGNDVSWSLAGTTLSVQADGQMLYSGNRKQALTYKQHACTTVYPCFFNCTHCSDSNLSSDITVNVRAYLPLSVGGKGRNQTVQITTTSKGVTVSGHLSGGGPSGSDDLEAQVNQQIRDQVPKQIADKLSIQFDAVSVFALKNLLFPAGNYITFSACAVPGDLLLLGNFTAEN